LAKAADRGAVLALEAYLFDCAELELASNSSLAGKASQLAAVKRKHFVWFVRSAR
jgi:hypothetical protein